MNLGIKGPEKLTCPVRRAIQVHRLCFPPLMAILRLFKKLERPVLTMRFAKLASSLLTSFLC